MATAPRVPVTIKLPPDLLERLDLAAEKMQITRSECAYRLIRNGISEAELLLDHPFGDAVRRLAELVADPEFKRELRTLRKRLDERRRQPNLPGVELA